MRAIIKSREISNHDRRHDGVIERRLFAALHLTRSI